MSQQRRASTAERWAVSGIFVVIFGSVVAAVFLVFGGAFDMDPDVLANKFAQIPGKLREHPIDVIQILLILFAMAASIWYPRRAAKLERVFLDATGVRYQSPLPDFLRPLRPSWSLQWSQLRELRIAVPKATYHPNLVFLEFDAGEVRKKLQALYWVPEDSKARVPEELLSWRDRFFVGSGSARERERILRAAEQSPIILYAKQVGVKVTTGAMRQPGFTLESNRHTLAAAIIVIVLVLYTLFDMMLPDESYAVDPPLVLFALGGAIAALAAMLWLAFSGAPRPVGLGLALLLGAATAFALYPGALRINEATDSEGLHSYEYRLKSYSVFEPVDPKLPPLDFSNFNDYWGQFKLGTTHQFELRKGGLGFYQVDMAPVRDRMRAYFSGKR